VREPPVAEHGQYVRLGSMDDSPYTEPVEENAIRRTPCCRIISGHIMRGDGVLCEVLGGVRRARTAYYPSRPRSNLGPPSDWKTSVQDPFAASFQSFDAFFRRLFVLDAAPNIAVS
jgi:hypothetical protein